MYFYCFFQDKTWKMCKFQDKIFFSGFPGRVGGLILKWLYSHQSKQTYHNLVLVGISFLTLPGDFKVLNPDPCQTNLLATLGKYQNPRWHAQHENNLWTEISLALSIFYNILHYTKLHDAPLLIRNWLHIMRTGQFPTRLFLYYMINDYYKSICSATDYRYAYKSQSIVQLTLCWTGGLRSPPMVFSG